MEKFKERMLELLADQALFGLTVEESADLERLKNSFPDFKNDDSFEMAAAAINLINLNIDDSLPPSLLAKLESQAAEFLGAPTKTREFASFEMNQPAELPQNVFARSIEEFAPKPSIWQWLGWAVAAAACIALAINLWLTRFQPQPEVAETPKTIQTPEPEIVQIPEVTELPETGKTPEIVKIPEAAKTPAAGNAGNLRNQETARNPEPVRNPGTARNSEVVRNQGNVGVPKIEKTPEIARIPELPKPPPPELSAAQRREQLLASAPDVIQTNWISPKNKKEVLGDVVWSNAQQKGYVRLRDLPALDPNLETYQLWIVDEAQNKKTPVSVGLFNVGQAGEAVVAINPQLRIQKPKSFAVTKEKAGGVVVSKPNRIVAIAKL